MRSIKNFIRGKGRRVLAILIALSLCAALACAEEYASDEWVPVEMLTEAADTGTFVTNDINRDADVRLGCVVSSAALIRPFDCNERDLISVNRLVFESMVELDVNDKPSPMLADRWEKEGKLWKFHLREGIVFHNGMALTANDVVQSYVAFATSAVATPYSRSLTALVDSMEELDTYTVGVHAKYDGYMTLYAMTFPVVQASTFYEPMPRGTGPYWYTEYLQGVGVRLEMNPIWWKKDAKVRSIAAINYYDTGDAVEALQIGEIDMLCSQSSRISLTRKLSNFTSMDYTTNIYEVLMPNLKSSVMSDLRIRKAIMYAIDRASVAENAYGGMGIQCEVPVNPNSWLYESQSAVFYYSPERAYQLIRECGWSDMTNDGKFNKVDGVRLLDLEITIVTYNDTVGNVREAAANLIAGYLENVGMKVNVVATDKTSALKRVNKGNYDLALIGLQLSEVPILKNLLEPKGSLNINGYTSPTLETLVGETLTAADEDSLKSTFSDMQMQIVEELPFLGLLFRTGTILSTRSLSGMTGSRVYNTLKGMEFLELEGR